MYVTECCNSFALDSWKYCPKCGNLAERASGGVETNDELDFDQTTWFCAFCGEGIPMRFSIVGIVDTNDYDKD